MRTRTVRTLGLTIGAAGAAWLMAAAPASARTSFEDAPNFSSLNAIAIQASGRRPAPAPALDEGEERSAQPPRREEEARDRRDRLGIASCAQGQTDCERRRRTPNNSGGSGGSGEAIPDSALMRQRTIL